MPPSATASPARQRASPARQRRTTTEPTVDLAAWQQKATAASTAAAASSPGSYLQTLILLAVFLDMTGVALVVPNLVFRWKEVGISPAGLGMVGSIYSASQLVGGLVLGKLGDRGLGRKRTLLLSFAGAGISYALVGLAESIWVLVVSRVLVGLVKQTMTISMALTINLSSESTRASSLGRLSSASTLAFLSGQAAGGALSSRFGRRAPCFVASALFAVNFTLILLLLPSDAPSTSSAPSATPTASVSGDAAARGDAPSKASAPSGRKGEAAPPAVAQAVTSRWGKLRAGFVTFAANFTSAFRSPMARDALLFRLSYGFLMRATYSLHSLYEQQRFELTPETAGFLSTYRTALGLSVDSVLIGVLSRYLCEGDLLLVALSISAANAALEGGHSSFNTYAFVNMPLSSMTGPLTRGALSSLFSKAVNTADAGAALSVLDVCNSAVGVLAPMYGGFLLSSLGVGYQPHLSCAHYVLLVVLARMTIAARKRNDSEPKAKHE